MQKVDVHLCKDMAMKSYSLTQKYGFFLGVAWKALFSCFLIFKIGFLNQLFFNFRFVYCKKCLLKCFLRKSILQVSSCLAI